VPEHDKEDRDGEDGSTAAEQTQNDADDASGDERVRWDASKGGKHAGCDGATSAP
jgi:hypothetical protein